MKNEFILDGKIQSEVREANNTLIFNVSSITGTVQEDNRSRPKFTYIKVIYTGVITRSIRETIKERNFVRIYGKLDSERLESKSGKIVYNKVLKSDNIQLFDYSTQAVVGV